MSTGRREFLQQAGRFLLLTGSAARAFEFVVSGRAEAAPDYDSAQHWWGMVIDIEKCIGCGSCVRACKEENGVSPEPYYFRTWVERYRVRGESMEHPEVDSPNGGFDGFPERYKPGDGAKSFFVPKLCNHCVESPCVQVCPVGRPSAAGTAWCSWTKTTAWAAGTASRPAPTGAATSTRGRIPLTSARSAITASPRG